MDDLIVFLRAQLDEDERVAREATSGPWWHNPGKQWLGPEAFEKYDLRQGEEFVGYGGPHPFTGAVCSTGPASNMQSMKDAAFIATHDPARVLREIEAKRGIVDRYERAMENRRAHPDDLASAGALLALHGVVELLALPFEDRPGFQESWRP